jgi:hypothetical protein
MEVEDSGGGGEVNKVEEDRGGDDEEDRGGGDEEDNGEEKKLR